MTKKKSGPLPETLYVANLTEDGTTCFQAAADVDDHAELNRTVEVGEYRLVRMVKLTNDTTVTP